MNFFQIVKFCLEIVEIFAKMSVLQYEIAFFHLVRVFKVVIP